MFSFKEEKVDKLHPISRGAGGIVYPYDKRPGKQKEWVVKELTTNVKELRYIVQEAVFGFNHDHPFILSIAGYHIEDCEDGNIKIYLRMPRMKKSLGDLIDKNQFSKEKVDSDEAKKTIIKWFYCLADALNYLKKKNIAHRDIKPENILLDDKNTIYLSDLGLSKYSGDDVTAYITNIAGTPRYMAPEYSDKNFLENLRSDDFFRADVWSLGMTILDLCIGSRKDPENNNIMDDVNKKLSKVAERYGSSLTELLSKLLKFDPHKRCNYEQICEFIQTDFSDCLDEVFKTWEQRVEDLHGGFFFKTRQNFFERLNQLTEAWQRLKDTLEDKFKFEVHEEVLIEPKDLDLSEDEFKKSIRHIFESSEKNLSRIFRSIKINFENCLNINSEAAGLIKFDKPQFEKVQKLSLNLALCENMITQDGKLPFAPNSFKGLIGLKSLDLNLSGIEKLTNQNLEEVYSLITTDLPKLEKLSLNFRHCPQVSISDEVDIKKLKSYLDKLAFLKELTIEASGNIPSDLEKWRKDLERINKLRVVELDIS